MQRSTISKRQFCFLLTFAPLVGKATMLPSFIAAISKNGAPFSAAILLMVEICMLWLVYEVQINGGIEVLKSKLPRWALIALWVPAFAVITMVSSLMLAGLTNYVAVFLYDKINNIKVILVILMLILYMGLKGSNIVGRVAEMTIWFAPLVLIISFFTGRAEMRFELLLPILWSNAGPVLKAAFLHVFWSLNYFPFLFVKVEGITEKRPRISFYAFITVFLVVFFYVGFIASFGNSAGGMSFALPKMVGFSGLMTKLGSFDWLGISFWMIYIIIYLSFSSSAVPTLLELADVKFARPIAVALFNIGMFVTLAAVIKNLNETQKIATSPYAFIVSAFTFLFAAAVLIFLKMVKKADERES